MSRVNIELLIKVTIGCILLVVGLKGYNNVSIKRRALALTTIEASSAALTAHMLAGHGDSIALLYAEDAVILPANMSAVRGREAIRAYYAGFPPMAEGGLTTDTIVVFGDLAYVRGRYSVRFVDSMMPPDSGKYIEIRRRGDEGNWLIIEEVSNSSVPLPHGAP
ncbi:MAG: DUF4440 domain-containing protein [Actinomycetota bacterium]|nr:DUF4440 domain-containing protein [Actinomycetota bacterium]